MRFAPRDRDWRCRVHGGGVVLEVVVVAPSAEQAYDAALAKVPAAERVEVIDGLVPVLDG